MKNEIKQTAVDWLFIMLNNPNRNQEFAKKLFQRAKEIEQNQIIDAHLCGQNSAEEVDGQTEIQYYQQNYGGNDQ
jgi:hypothetical protein